MAWRQNGNKNENRVSNPFGGTPATSQSNPFGTFGQQTSTFGSFGSSFQASPFGTAPRLQNTALQAPSNGKGKGKGKGFQESQPSSSMQDDTAQVNRVNNPFAAIGAAPSQALSTDEAVNQFKNEYIRKKGYPFSCYGLAEEPPVLTGDISPAELRWYLSQASGDIHKAISERSTLLNEDFTEFLRAAGDGAPVLIKRAGPYRIPDPDFPPFVPRNEFSLIDSRIAETLSDTDRYVYQTKSVPEGGTLPTIPPPLDMR